MAGIRKRTWKNKSGVHSCYEITFVVDGKQYRKSGYESKLDAQIDLKNVVSNPNIDISFQLLAYEYINKHCSLSCKPTTKSLYESYLNNYFETIKNKSVIELKKMDIENIVVKLQNNGLSNKTIKCIVNFAKSVLNYGIENEFLLKNPLLKFKIQLAKPPIITLNEKQIDIFLQELKNVREPQQVFISTAFYTGMRISEITGLEWSDIDFKRKTITVNKQIYRGVKQATKTNKERVIDINDTLLNLLKEHKINNTYLSKLVFHNGNGEPMHTCSLKEHYFHPLIKRCNKLLDVDNQIENFRFHDLRHTHATYLLSHGVPIKYVQERLGHSSARMTLDTYAKFMPSVKSGALDLLENLENKPEIEHKLSIENGNSTSISK